MSFHALRMSTDHRADRPTVTVIGLGLMGSALARAFLRAGHPTTVWNRSVEKADPLVAAGATHADSVADAVAASPLVIACVLEHAVLQDVLAPAAGALAGRTLVNLTSGTPEDARATAAWVTEQGAEYLDGKILAFPSTVGQPEAFLLYSGPRNAFAAHEPTLAVLGRATHLGADPGLAAAHDLGLLGLMYGTATGFLHSLAVLGSEGVEPRAFLPHATDLVAALPALLEDLVEQTASGEFGGREANLKMQTVFLGHMIEVSRTRGVDPAFPVYLKGLMDQAIAAGHGDDDFGRLLEELVVPASAA